MKNQARGRAHFVKCALDAKMQPESSEPSRDSDPCPHAPTRHRTAWVRSSRTSPDVQLDGRLGVSTRRWPRSGATLIAPRLAPSPPLGFPADSTRPRQSPPPFRFPPRPVAPPTRCCDLTSCTPSYSRSGSRGLTICADREQTGEVLQRVVVVGVVYATAAARSRRTKCPPCPPRDAWRCCWARIALFSLFCRVSRNSRRSVTSL
jgi:hypothetical protein